MCILRNGKGKHYKFVKSVVWNAGVDKQLAFVTSVIGSSSLRSSILSQTKTAQLAIKYHTYHTPYQLISQ